MITIRLAKTHDVEVIAKLAARNKKELGFILYPQYHEAIRDEALFVALKEEKIVGFVLFHHRRDSQTTLNYLCVKQEERRQGIGNMLVAQTVLAAHKARKTCVVLKAIETIEANHFYSAQGFLLSEQIQGKHHKMNVWKLSWEEQV